MDAMDALEQIIERSWQQRAEAIESACEQMLVTPGALGVLVEDLPMGQWRVSLSSEVPAMEITYR